VVVRVTALLAEEALDLLAQGRIVDLGDELLLRADEEPLPVREQQIHTIGDRGCRRVTEQPVARDGGQLDIEISGDDRLRHILNGNQY